MKIVISIFCLPYEIDELENTLNQLRVASHYIDKSIDWNIDVTMCISDKMVNWDKSSINKKYFQDKFLKLSSHTDWCVKHFQASDTILGCVSQRRYSLERHKDADYFIWLDTDIIFEERTLSYMENAMKSTNELYSNSIITPEIVKIWDDTWDCIVNENFIDKKVNYQKNNDPYKDSGVKGDIAIVGVNNNFINQPRFKFAGGWFTCISGKLLNRIGVPKSFGHYGYEDTFVMWASEKLIKEKGEKIQQFKIKNLVVCENYKYRNNSHYLNHISVYDRREEFKKIAESNFSAELKKIQ
jgi:hypothetical protein|tara:strand:+ start:628 stop:1521 length:894 start_codon:yes stop_codon:yes gene_type:complete